MILAILKRLTAPKPPQPDPLDAIIARRGQCLHNRSREAAARYERVQTILARGKK